MTQVAVADDAAAGGVGEVAVGAPQERPDPAHQLAQGEGLGDVVVRAQLEADDLVELVAAGGQEQDRRLGADRAQAAEDLEAVDAREADVEHDQVGRLGRGELQPLLARARDGHLVALLLEGVLDAARDGELVFDDQDGGCHGADSTPGAVRGRGSVAATRACATTGRAPRATIRTRGVAATGRARAPPTPARPAREGRVVASP